MSFDDELKRIAMSPTTSEHSPQAPIFHPHKKSMFQLNNSKYTDIWPTVERSLFNGNGPGEY